MQHVQLVITRLQFLHASSNQSHTVWITVKLRCSGLMVSITDPQIKRPRLVAQA